MKRSLTLGSALLVAAAAGIPAAPANIPAPAAAAVSPVMPCPDEDYAGPRACYWDAAARGNGAGRSFTWTGATVIYSSER